MIGFSRRAFKNPLALLLLGAFAILTAQSIARLVVRAEGAALLFSPSSGTYASGKTFTVKVALNSGGGVGVNASDGTVSFDPSMLSVISVSKDNSIFSLWTSEPTFSNAKGTVVFSGGSPSGYSKDGGTIISITFKALKAGTASISFSAGSALAADGKGTNVISSTGKGSFTISEGATPPPAPPTTPEDVPSASDAPAPSTGAGFPVSIEITSPTHPDQQKWYSNKNPELKWKLTPDLNGVSALLSPRSEAVPPRISEGEVESKKFEDTADGAWYFLVRFKSQSGSWSDVIRRKVFIDTVSPEGLTLEVKSDDTTAPPIILIGATDKTSGIDHYEARIDDKDPILIGIDQIVNGEYKLPAILPGAHKVEVRALDKAGNASTATRNFTIEGRATIEITNSPGAIEESERLLVEGLADPGAKVVVRIESAGKAAAEEAVKTDDEGRWVFAHRKTLRAGEYDILAKMITRAGAETGFTPKVPLVVNPAPFMQRYGGALVMLLIFCMIGLVFYGLSERKEVARRREVVKREVEEVHQKTEAVFSALLEEVEEKIRFMDDAEALKANVKKLSPLDVQEKLREALDISEDALMKEIEDVEKALGE